MTIQEYINGAPRERQEVMAKLHDLIPYEDQAYMKYGLANTQKHLSLHCLPACQIRSLATGRGLSKGLR